MSNEDLEIMFWLGRYSRKCSFNDAEELLKEFKSSMYYFPIYTIENGVKEFIKSVQYVNSTKK